MAATVAFSLNEVPILCEKLFYLGIPVENAMEDRQLWLMSGLMKAMASSFLNELPILYEKIFCLEVPVVNVVEAMK